MLSRLLLTVLVAPVAAGVTLMPVAGSAAAPPCKAQTVADSTKSAMAVFAGEVASVTREERPAGQPGAYFLHNVTVTRVYQGEIDTESVVVRTTTAPPSAQECGLGKLPTDTPYMFFVGSTGDPWTASGNGGTAPADEQLVAQVERLLGAGSPPVEPVPEEAVFTPVDTSEPATLSRAVAPGLAMIIVGLLGLMLVRFLSRRPG